MHGRYCVGVSVPVSLLCPFFALILSPAQACCAVQAVWTTTTDHRRVCVSHHTLFNCMHSRAACYQLVCDVDGGASGQGPRLREWDCCPALPWAAGCLSGALAEQHAGGWVSVKPDDTIARCRRTAVTGSAVRTRGGGFIPVKTLEA